LWLGEDLNILAALGLEALLFTLICWTMVQEMKRFPNSGFFRPVLKGFFLILIVSAPSFAPNLSLHGSEKTAAVQALAEQLQKSMVTAAGDTGPAPYSPAQVQAFSEVLLRLQPAMVCIFWLGILSLAAAFLRKRLAARGLTKAVTPLSRWKAPDWLIWVLFLPAALLLLDERQWLGEVEPWISALCSNIVVVMLAVYLFQGVMVVLEKISRFGLPKIVAVIMLVMALAIATVLALLPAGQGIALCFFSLGILDTWLDFRKLTPKTQDKGRSHS
jgi:hypothetical protein